MSEEEKVLYLTKDLWNALVKLKPVNPSELSDHQSDLHNIQNRIAARIYWKEQRKLNKSKS